MLSTVRSKQVQTDAVKSFPLYDKLAKEALDNPHNINIKTLAATLSKIDNVEHAENIFLLMYHHYVINRGNTFVTLPYAGSSLPGGKGATFPITSVPPALQQILIKYIEHVAV